MASVNANRTQLEREVQGLLSHIPHDQFHPPPGKLGAELTAQILFLERTLEGRHHRRAPGPASLQRVVIAASNAQKERMHKVLDAGEAEGIETAPDLFYLLWQCRIYIWNDDHPFPNVGALIAKEELPQEQREQINYSTTQERSSYW